MSTQKWPEGRLEGAEGTLSLSAVDSQKRFAIGYEFGACPGDSVHLDLRFKDKPATGIDGTPFPAALWEQSPNFTLPDQSVQLAGITAFKSKSKVPGQPNINEFAALDREAWKKALSAHMNVKARWFVVHDTAGGGVPRSAAGIDSNDSGVHMFMDTTSLYLNNDFSEAHDATGFQHLHKEFHCEFVHVELVYPLTDAEIAEAAAALREKRTRKEIFVKYPPPPPGGYNYDALALAYIFASYRAGSWLTVTCHLEVDRAIGRGHHDPRGFKFEMFYEKIIAFMGGSTSSISDILRPPPITFPFPDVLGGRKPTPPSPAIPRGSTFGILAERIKDNMNYATDANTFPAQYGPVKTKKELLAVGAGGKKGKK